MRSQSSTLRVLAVSIGGILIVGLLLAFYILRGDPFSLEERSIGSNLSFFALINLLIIALITVAFLVARNLVKLMLDRRRRILGARLRSRLLIAFVGLAFIPTVLLFLVARGILESVLQGWFSPQVAASVDGAVKVAKYHYDEVERALYRDVGLLARNLGALLPYVQRSGLAQASTEAETRRMLEEFLSQKLREFGLGEIAVVNLAGQTVLAVAASGQLRVPPPNLRAVSDAALGTIVVRPEESYGETSIVRGYAGVVQPALAAFFGVKRESGPQAPAGLVLIASVAIAPELDTELLKVIEAFDDYRELKSYRGPLESSYILTLAVVTLMIVFSAIWVAFYLARSLSGPIQLLAEGTEQVAHGNLEYTVPLVGDDELSVLADSFNKMTADLRETTGELVARRRYMETVLASVVVGVMSLDRTNRIATFNDAAAQMLGIEYPGTVIGKQFNSVLPKDLAESCAQLISDLGVEDTRMATEGRSLYIGSKVRHLEVTATKLVSDTGEAVGVVVLLDDLTELVRAQRMAAWREVARRIAHEIKNPLTPIQLSAQRIERRFAEKKAGSDGTVALTEADRQVLIEATATIVRQVETLRTLVNEFSQFARMPKSIPEAVNLNDLIRESGRVFSQAHADIEFLFDLDARVPVVEVDRAQIGRVLINLIDNAVAAVHQRFGAGGSAAAKCAGNAIEAQAEVHRAVIEALTPNWGPCISSAHPVISLESRYDEGLGLVTFVVSDNGLGVADEDKPRLFEPYFSRKKGGTGLGLAIVSSIIADHQGFIRLRDNQPSGACFIVELPAGEAGRTSESTTRDIARL